MVRAFTLLEITISVVVVGIISALALPSVGKAIDARQRDAIGEHAVSMVGTARDAARTQLACVTVAPIEVCNGIGLTTWTHTCPPDTTSPTLIDDNANLIPDEATFGGAPPVLIEQFTMDPAQIAAVEVLQPASNCVGTTTQASPPITCYEPTSWFQYRADGTTTKPFSVRITHVDGVKHDFVVQPGSGSLRAVD
ncbi:MAG: type II secretion system protein [Deltaproteobacteria bacterium]|nr:type II secretion system protein [Deltaproteobacteria bacterium]